jgi:hypothetical protein
VEGAVAGSRDGGDDRALAHRPSSIGR